MGLPIHSMGIMEEDHHHKMSAIKEQIQRGDYHVDPAIVAEAILRRIRGHGQNACSYPDSFVSESTNTTPASPCATEPIQVTAPVVTLGPCAARAGTHAQ